MVTAVAALSSVLPSAGTTTMVVNDNTSDVDGSDHAPQALAFRSPQKTTTDYYGLLVFLPIVLMAAVATAYYIIFR